MKSNRNATIEIILHVDGESPERVEDCLASLRDQDFTDFGVLVVDDGSSKDTGKILKDACSRHGADCIRSPVRRGFAESVRRTCGVIVNTCCLIVPVSPSDGPFDRGFTRGIYESHMKGTRVTFHHGIPRSFDFALHDCCDEILSGRMEPPEVESLAPDFTSPGIVPPWAFPRIVEDGDIVMIRHGHRDLKALSDCGMFQAEMFGGCMPRFDHIYSSPVKRVVDTSLGIGGLHGTSVEILDELSEDRFEYMDETEIVGALIESIQPSDGISLYVTHDGIVRRLENILGTPYTHFIPYNGGLLLRGYLIED